VTIDAQTVALVGTILTIVLGGITLVKALIAVGVRVGTLEAEHRLMIRLVLGDAHVDAIRKGLLQSQSPVRLDARIASYFKDNGIGDRLASFYRHRKLRNLPDALAKWELYREFLDEWESKVSQPLGINLSLALEVALQFCKDGDA
jgi:hypothetical protein